MQTKIELFLLGTTLAVNALVILTALFRKPNSSARSTFIIFSFLFFFWNCFEIMHRFFAIEPLWLKIFQLGFSQATLYSLVVFSLNFPYFGRRSTKLIYFTAFLGGVGYIILMMTFAWPFVEIRFPLDFQFFAKFSQLLSRAYSVLCVCAFLVISFSKLTQSVAKLKKIFYRVLGFTSLITVLVFLYNFYLLDIFTPLSPGIDILYIDTLFLLLIVAALIQFKFILFYPGFLSLVVYGELPLLVIHNQAPANQAGTAYLKDELWRIYEVESWSTFISEFWYGIIIDETLDNALEHGGKRFEDKITIQVYETSKYLDFYVIDMGKGFDPETLPNPADPNRKNIPTGRGIYIMRKLFQVDWNFLGNEIRVRVSKNPADNPSDI